MFRTLMDSLDRRKVMRFGGSFAGNILPPTFRNELVLNGRDWTGAPDGWTTAFSTLAAVAGGDAGNCLEVTNSAASLGYAYQTLATIPGAKYKFTWWHKNGTLKAIMYIGTSIGGAQLYDSGYLDDDASGAGVTRSIFFTATTATTRIRLGNGVNTAGGTTLFDSVSCIRVR